jgi:putative ABC transport system permease protein
MLRNQFRFLVRIFLKDKFFSSLNILGLALGIAVSILLLLILQNDLTYDQYHVSHKRIFRLGGHLEATGVDNRRARSARELGVILKEELPEVLEVVRANNWDHTLVKYENKGVEKAFYEEDIVRTDSTYFRVFTHEFIAGDPKTCLTDLNTLVVTESTAKKYFGDEDPINKSLIIDNAPWRVTAVIKDLPENTHLKFDILLSRLVDREWVMDKGQVKSEAFWNPDVYIYLLMPEGYNPNDFEAKFPAIYNKYFKGFGDQVSGKYTPILEPLADIHFHSKLGGDEPQGNITYLYAFTGIGAFIILLACINYMNLSTAKSVTRATEIAMKKTLGSGKRKLVLAFLGESVFLSLVSLSLAIVFVFIVLRLTSFNQLIDKNLAPDFFHNPLLLWGSLGIAAGIGIISGLYPAFYLPNIPTLSALKGVFKNKKSNHLLRKVLITTQFSVSIFVVVCTLFMQDQIDYVRSKELGFDKENVVLLHIEDTLMQNHISAIKNEFLQNPRITAATTGYNVMGIDMSGGVMWAESETGMKQQAFSLMFVGENYLKTMAIKLLSGRDFQLGPQADVKDVFLANEAAAKLMGWGNEGVGKKVKFFHGETNGQVIGIVKDFNFSSLHNAIDPLLIVKADKEGGYLYLRVLGEDLPKTLRFIKEKWTQYDTSHPFEYSFLDQRFNEQYKADEVQHKLLSGLSSICIFISLLGLLGLSAFSATQRTKEIGVRKVLGATVSNIIYMLSKDVLLLVVVASVLVIPVSYWVIDGWMSNFAYRTELNYLFFVFVTVMALGFVFLTVAFHSLKTARTNPSKSLRTE